MPVTVRPKQGSCITIGIPSADNMTSISIAWNPCDSPQRIAASVFSGASDPPPRCAIILGYGHIGNQESEWKSICHQCKSVLNQLRLAYRACHDFLPIPGACIPGQPLWIDDCRWMIWHAYSAKGRGKGTTDHIKYLRQHSGHLAPCRYFNQLLRQG